MVKGDVGEGRPRDIGEHAAVEEAAGPSIAEQPALAQQFAVAEQRAAQRLLAAPAGRMRLWQGQQRGQRREANTHKHPEDRAPSAAKPEGLPPTLDAPEPSRSKSIRRRSGGPLALSSTR